ncbi:MAG: DUF2804 domain-containing protein [Lachnospiraceae bacterium]|nr:DUF2804 domain-containing protein [Lachnospiraceae bacterium]
MRNHEVTKEQNLLNEQGEIAEPGWARRQYQKYIRRDIKAKPHRIKEWDYYMVMHDGGEEDSYAICFTISDDGYVGLQSVSLLKLSSSNPWEHTETILNVFPMGKLHMPEDSSTGDVFYKDKRLQMRFRVRERRRIIDVNFKDFYEGKQLRAHIVLRQPNMDTMVIATPWDQPHAFYYNQKINSMRAKGRIEFDGKLYQFDEGPNYGTLDWGRGVWTYDNTWYWGSGNACVDGHDVGFNIGYGFGNTEAATENVIFYDGVVHKLDDVMINIPGDIDLYNMDAPRYMDEWTIHESSGRFEMTFKPVLDRAAKMDFKMIVSDQHQVFGRMSGKMVLDDGKEVILDNVLCFIEKVHNKY